MPADVQLDTPSPDWVDLQAAVVRSNATDWLLDNPTRRHGEGGDLRRALVHDVGDALTLNFNDDYSGGLRLNDAHLRLHVEHQRGEKPSLPKDAETGQLMLIMLTPAGEIGHLRGREASLWLCIGRPVLATAPVLWVPIQLGEPVSGSVER